MFRTRTKVIKQLSKIWNIIIQNPHKIANRPSFSIFPSQKVITLESILKYTNSQGSAAQVQSETTLNDIFADPQRVNFNQAQLRSEGKGNPQRKGVRGRNKKNEEGQKEKGQRTCKHFDGSIFFNITAAR